MPERYVEEHGERVFSRDIMHEVQWPIGFIARSRLALPPARSKQKTEAVCGRQNMVQAGKADEAGRKDMYSLLPPRRGRNRMSACQRVPEFIC